ncbi:glycosyltransferase family 25 protein [uncultured Deefgea sp.]|uniref:glycosyltransferase family 25 protein n=1 Tax=uncultured Deefgea sp. TaxID=1304914 RepID=UPI00261685DE|nr:glycosyltransferase family 25 protein [uncultured Deefgea sp.]
MIYYCISLPDQIDRRARMTQQFTQLSLKVNWFDAIRPDDDMPVIYQRTKRLNQYGYDLTTGEMGCFLSHRAVWLDFINRTNENKSNDLCSIFEDDIILNTDFCNIITELETIKDQWDYVRFFAMFSRKKTNIQSTLPSGHQLIEFLKPPRGTQGYILNRHAALTLLNLTEQMIHPIDDTIDQVWRHNLKMFCITPALVIEDANLVSSIGSRKRSKLKLSTKIKRELYRAPEAVRRTFWQYKTRLRWLFQR